MNCRNINRGSGIRDCLIRARHGADLVGMEPNTPRAPRRTSYLNGILSVLAALLAMDIAVRVLGPGQALVGGSEAVAQDKQPGEGAGLLNPEDQRKQIIAELRRISKQADAIKARLDAGLKITDMPEVKVAKEKPEG